MGKEKVLVIWIFIISHNVFYYVKDQSHNLNCIKVIVNKNDFSMSQSNILASGIDLIKFELIKFNICTKTTKFWTKLKAHSVDKVVQMIIFIFDIVETIMSPFPTMFLIGFLTVIKVGIVWLSAYQAENNLVCNLDVKVLFHAFSGEPEKTTSSWDNRLVNNYDDYCQVYH